MILTMYLIGAIIAFVAIYQIVTAELGELKAKNLVLFIPCTLSWITVVIILAVLVSEYSDRVTIKNKKKD